MSPIEVVLKQASERPNDIAFYFGQREWSYSKLKAEADAAAAFLLANGVTRGDRVALHLPNSPHLISGLLGCFRIGAIAVPVNNRFKARELAVVFDRTKPRYYIGDSSFQVEIDKLGVEILPPEQRLFLQSVKDRDYSWPSSHIALRSHILTPSSPEAPSLLLPTSGTTGDPKIVIHTSGTLSAISNQYEAFGLLSSDVMLNASPMVHAGGLFNLIASLARKGPMVMMERFDPDAVLDAVEAMRCTWFKGLPFMFDQLIAAQRERSRDVQSLRLVVSSGDVCPQKTRLEFKAVFGRTLFSAWASSEAATSLSICAQDNSTFEIAKTGYATLGEISDLNASECDEGELVVSGPNVSPGYWQYPGEIVQNLDHKFNTGDLMKRVPTGLIFVGRKKNLIIRAGSNISPVEVESALKLSPMVKDAAVFGIPDAKLGEKVGAFIELSPTGRQEMLTDVITATRADLSEYKVPEFFITVDALPRGANGKIDRAALLPLFQARTTGPVHSPSEGR